MFEQDLMAEITFMLETSSAKELDTGSIRKKLSSLEEKDPLSEKFDPEKEWKAFIADHPFPER